MNRAPRSTLSLTIALAALVAAIAVPSFAGTTSVSAAERGSPRIHPKIPLDVSDSQRLPFTRPGGLDAGPAYVEALAPPLIPFTASIDPKGVCTLP